MISNQLLWIVLSTHNLDPSRSILSLFKIFKFQPLQVWTRFIIFGEIHIFLSPKISPKFRQPPDAMRGHPTKNQLKENSPHAKIISSNTWPALFLCTFRKFRKLRVCSVVFRQRVVTDHPCALARCAQPLLPGQSTAHPLGRTQVLVAVSIADAGSFCGGRATRGGQREPVPACYAVWCRPTPPCPLRDLMHASAPPQHRRRGPASTGRALCRRRARAAPFRRIHP